MPNSSDSNVYADPVVQKALGELIESLQAPAEDSPRRAMFGTSRRNRKRHNVPATRHLVVTVQDPMSDQLIQNTFDSPAGHLVTVRIEDLATGSKVDNTVSPFDGQRIDIDWGGLRTEQPLQVTVIDPQSGRSIASKINARTVSIGFKEA